MKHDLAARPALWWALSRLLGGRETAEPKSEALRLAPDETVRFNQKADLASITVSQGKIWLTETPAREDIVLRAGESYTVGGACPIVVQALGEAELCLHCRS